MSRTKNTNIFLFLGLFAIPTVICSIAWISALSDKEPEVVITHSSVQEGYARVPASYDITASPHYKWTHEGVSAGRMFIAFLLFAVGAAIVFVDWGYGKALPIYAVFLIGGVLLSIGKYSFHYYEIKKYEKAIDSTTYEANKADLDKIFEQ
jgi:hypothetical protein